MHAFIPTCSYNANSPLSIVYNTLIALFWTLRLHLQCVLRVSFRLSLHEQRQNLIRSLHQRLCSSGEEAEYGSSLPPTGLSNLISVHKGLLLAIRLLPLLEKVC